MNQILALKIYIGYVLLIQVATILVRLHAFHKESHPRTLQFNAFEDAFGICLNGALIALLIYLWPHS